MLFCVVAVFFCCLLVSKYQKLKKVSYTDISPYTSTTVEYVSGEKISLNGVEFGPVNKGDRVAIQVFLPVDMKINPSVLAFGLNHAVTEVYFGDTLLDSYGKDISARGDLICHHNYFIKIPEEAWGKSLTVNIRATENKAFNRISNFWLYPAEKAYYFFFDLEYGRMLISLSVLIISITVLSAIPLLLYQDRKKCYKLLCIAIFGTASAMWMILSEGLQQFFDVNSYLLTTFEFVALPMQVLPLDGYVWFEETNRGKRKKLLGMLEADGIFVTVICLLNYLNIAHFTVTLSASIAFIVLNSVVLVWNSFQNMNFSAASKRVTLLGVAVISLTGAFDVIRFSLYRSIGTAEYSHTQKTFPFGVLLFYVFLLISVIISDREQHEKEKHDHAKLLAGQIQPHFLYNTLASIKELVYEAPPCAIDALTDFTVYLRGAVHAMSDVQVVLFDEELKNIRAYAEIEKIRMPDRLKIEYQIEASDFVLPPFSIQPFVENAIRHGIYNRGSEGGTVNIRTCFQEDKWLVEISDTGIGFDVREVMERVKEKDSNSAGLKNVISRLQEIIHASVSIHSVPGEGTVITVAIPQRYNREVLNGRQR